MYSGFWILYDWPRLPPAPAAGQPETWRRHTARGPGLRPDSERNRPAGVQLSPPHRDRGRGARAHVTYHHGHIASPTAGTRRGPARPGGSGSVSESGRRRSRFAHIYTGSFPGCLSELRLTCRVRRSSGCSCPCFTLLTPALSSLSLAPILESLYAAQSLRLAGCQ